MAHSPNFNIFVCKDHPQSQCEEYFEYMCPDNYELCSAEQYNNNSHGWIGKSPSALLGKIYCRSDNGTEQLTLGSGQSYSSQISLKDPNFGSYLPECPWGYDYGCTVRRHPMFAALCCRSLSKLWLKSLSYLL